MIAVRMFFIILTFTIFAIDCNAYTLEDFLLKHQWNHFKTKYSKDYHSFAESDYRYLVFKKNVQTVSAHNRLYRKGFRTYHMKINKFADLTDKEFQDRYLFPDMPQDHFSHHEVSLHDFDNSKLPEKVDWRLKKAVTRVKDQKNCSACYAFAAVAALESHHYLHTGHLITLSEQQIIDCTFRKPGFYNKGCHGGNFKNTFKYIISNRGIDNDHAYPYISAMHPRCLYNQTALGAIMQSYAKTRPSNETDLKAAVARIGPVSVMLNAAKIRFYSGGLFNDPKCSKKLSHAMLVVGYGRFKKLDYWLLKNSWGVDWGEEGYILMSRNQGNQCGVASQGYYPVVKGRMVRNVL